MPTLILTFPGRCYHATPWGHHVNEGLIEWPPSPWRLIRALICVGYAKGLWGGGGPPAHVRRLFDKLAGDLPVYSLPGAIGTHSRHYMPQARFKNGREETTLVFDTWARIDHGALAVSWNVDLDEEERPLLAALAEKLGYLGRAESWVEAKLAREGETVPESNCFPGSSPPGPGWEQVPLLAPLPGEAAYAGWRREAVEALLAGFAEGAESGKAGRENKKLLEQREKALEPYPSDLLDALQKETAWMRNFGWNQPPGSRRVFYWRRRDAFRVGAPVEGRAPYPPPVKAMLLSMATRTGNRQALPSVIHSLIQGERLHKALVAVAGEHNRALSGCDEDGRPLHSRHEHAHFLPLDLDGDGHLDHFVVWAPMGLDGLAQRAVRAVRKTYAKNVESLHLALAASCNEMSELLALEGRYGDGLRALLGGIGGATEWVSRTPFVPPRHLKPRGKNSLEGQIAAELASRRFPVPSDIVVIDPHADPDGLRHRHFTRLRRNAPSTGFFESRP
ncbi:MAG: type I-U CRISPR-associated protein Cas5/Cas6 [Acidobacteria bacterium]|nr:type I-U CRISPR-associated protein Cas5/Cas6 [Acidobacteriota bacterium]